MTQIITYLTFNGNCREAMRFYQACLGGDLYLQTVGESPLTHELPPQTKNSILHASLKKENLVLMATDMVDETGLIRGNAVSILVECSSEREIMEYYQKLSKDGQLTQPVEKTFWGALFGSLTDKFGNHWLLNFSESLKN